MYMHAKLLSCVQLFATLWSVACQAPLSMGFSRQEYWSGFPCSSPGDLSYPGTEPLSPMAPALQEYSFTTELPDKPQFYHTPPPKNCIRNTEWDIWLSLTGILTIICFNNNRNPWILFWVYSLKECSLILPAF